MDRTSSLDETGMLCNTDSNLSPPLCSAPLSLLESPLKHLFLEHGNTVCQ
jgi:hypothetical protein